MKLYDEVPPSDRPRVLGLTASLLNAKVKFDDLESRIQELEKSMRSSVRTASDHGQVERELWHRRKTDKHSQMVTWTDTDTYTDRYVHAHTRIHAHAHTQYR